MVVFRIILVLTLLCAPAAWAQICSGHNNCIDNGESGLSVRGKLNGMLAHQFDVEQPPYSTAGSQYLQIQNAINDACSTTGAAGGIVLLGANNYNIGSNSINFDRCTRASLITGTTAGSPGVLTVTNSASFTTGNSVGVFNVGGTSEANGVWVITVVDGTHISLNGSTFTNGYSASFGIIADSSFKPMIWLQGKGVSKDFGISAIQCNTIGFCVDKHSVDRLTGQQMPGGLVRFDGIQVTNNLQTANGQTDPGGGALRLEGMQPPNSVSHCSFAGGVGISMAQTTFGGSLEHCVFNGSSFPMNVAAYMGQLQVSDLRAVGHAVGYIVNGATTMTNISTETMHYGILLGYSQPNAFRGFIDNGLGGGAYNGVPGNVLTVTQYIYGNFDGDDGSGAGGHGAGIARGGYPRTFRTDVCPVCTMNIAGQVTTTQPGGFNGAAGTYTVTGAAVAVPPQTLMTEFETPGATSASISNWQTERLDIGMIINAMTSATVSSSLIHGSLGLNIPTISPASSAATWAADVPHNGALTFTLSYNSTRNSTQTCYTEGFTGSITANGYNFNQNTGFPNGMTCRWAGSTVTIWGTDNATTIANPGTNSTSGSVSPRQDNCIKVKGAVNATTLSNIDCGINAPVSFDFSEFVTGRVVLDNITTTTNAISTSAPGARGGIFIRNSNISETLVGKIYATLPGVPGGGASNQPIDGEQHWIVDARNGVPGNSAEGGGSRPAVVVRMNGDYYIAANAGNNGDTFANKPVFPQAGSEMNITDGSNAGCGAPTPGTCTYGSVVTAGGGSLKLKLRYNGTAWTVMGQ